MVPSASIVGTWPPQYSSPPLYTSIANQSNLPTTSMGTESQFLSGIGQALTHFLPVKAREIVGMEPVMVIPSLTKRGLEDLYLFMCN